MFWQNLNANANHFHNTNAAKTRHSSGWRKHFKPFLGWQEKSWDGKRNFCDFSTNLEQKAPKTDLNKKHKHTIDTNYN